MFFVLNVHMGNILTYINNPYVKNNNGTRIRQREKDDYCSLNKNNSPQSIADSEISREHHKNELSFSSYKQLASPGFQHFQAYTAISFTGSNSVQQVKNQGSDDGSKKTYAQDEKCRANLGKRLGCSPEQLKNVLFSEEMYDLTTDKECPIFNFYGLVNETIKKGGLDAVIEHIAKVASTQKAVPFIVDIGRVKDFGGPDVVLKHIIQTKNPIIEKNVKFVMRSDQARNFPKDHEERVLIAKKLGCPAEKLGNVISNQELKYLSSALEKNASVKVHDLSGIIRDKLKNTTSEPFEKIMEELLHRANTEENPPLLVAIYDHEGLGGAKNILNYMLSHKNQKDFSNIRFVVKNPSEINEERIKNFPTDQKYREVLAQRLNCPVENLMSVVGPNEFKDMLKKVKPENFSVGGNGLSNVLSGKFNTDLHIHTIFSDGQFTIDRLMKEVLEYGHKRAQAPLTIAVSDHNELGGTKALLSYLAKYPYPEVFEKIRFVTGVEINGKYENKEFLTSPVQLECLQYAIDPFEDGINGFIKGIKESNKQIVKDIIEDAKKMGAKEADYLDAKSKCKSVRLSGTAKLTQELSNYLQTKGLTKEQTEQLFKKHHKTILSDGVTAATPNIENIVKACKSGVVSLSHPTKIDLRPNLTPAYAKKEDEAFKKLLDDFIKAGGNAIEANYQLHDEDIWGDMTAFKQRLITINSYCDENNILTTGGIDNRGKILFNRTDVPYVNRLNKRLKSTFNPGLRTILEKDNKVKPANLSMAVERSQNFSKYLKETMVGFITPQGTEWFEGACTNLIKATAGMDVPEFMYPRFAKDFWGYMSNVDPYWKSDEFVSYLSELTENEGVKASIHAIKEIQKEEKQPKSESQTKEHESKISFGYSSEMRFIKEIHQNGGAYCGEPLSLTDEHAFPTLEHLFPHIMGGSDDDDCNFVLANPEQNRNRAIMPLLDYLRGWDNYDHQSTFPRWRQVLKMRLTSEYDNFIQSKMNDNGDIDYKENNPYWAKRLNELITGIEREKEQDLEYQQQQLQQQYDELSMKYDNLAMEHKTYVDGSGIKELNKTIKQLRLRNRELQEEVNTTNDNLTRAVSETRTLKTTNTELQDKNKELEETAKKQNDRLYKKWQHTKQKHNNLVEQYQALASNEAYLELSQLNDSLQSTNQELERVIESLERERDHALQEITAREEENKKLQEKMISLKTEALEVSEVAQKWKGKFRSSQNRINTLLTNMEEMEEEKNKLSSSVRDYKAKVEQLENGDRYQEIRDENASLRKQIQTLEKDVETLKRYKKELQNEREISRMLKQDRRHLSKHFGHLKKEMAKLKSAGYEKGVEAFNQEIRELRQSLSERDAQISMLKQRFNALKEQLKRQ